MTTATILTSSGHVVGFQVDGHTGYADAGSDIVCSAISAITQTAVMGIEELLHIKVELQSRKGHLSCRIPDTADDKADLILETMLLGLHSIADQYENYLTIVKEEV